MCLLVLYFSPDHLRDPTNFAAVANKLICSPVTQVLVFTKVRLQAGAAWRMQFRWGVHRHLGFTALFPAACRPA